MAKETPVFRRSGDLWRARQSLNAQGAAWQLFVIWPFVIPSSFVILSRATSKCCTPVGQDEDVFQILRAPWLCGKKFRAANAAQRVDFFSASPPGPDRRANQEFARAT
jgi:hypothetical protein